MLWSSFREKLLWWVLCRSYGIFYLEGAKGEEEDAVQISINDLLHYVEQSVLLLGQSSNAINTP